MLVQTTDYTALYRDFTWPIPARFNIGTASLAHAPDALALIEVFADGRVDHWSFGAVTQAANRLSNLLIGKGLRRGDRVAVLLAQSAWCAIAHAAIYRAGMIAVPLFGLFGPEALAYRLGDCGARAIVTDGLGADKLAGLRADLADLAEILITGPGLEAALSGASDDFIPVDTAADDPAVIIYTSGTTGQPKGALHAHRVLLGHLPGVELPHDFFPQPGDRFWTPADWAWIGGLFDVLLPSWFHGVPVIAHRMEKFDPERAYALIARHAVRNLFLPPTAAKLMRQHGLPTLPLALRSVGSGGETLGAELLDWGRAAFGCPINEFYGQTECNLVVGNNAALFDLRPGSMGRALPGHRVAVIDEAGAEVPPGELGSIAVHRPDPVMFLGYWNRPQATAEKFRGDWLVTGDLGRRDAEGYFWYGARDDDVITSGGYRIGPGEIEDCLLRHPAVALAAVVGVPDPLRTEIVKACIVLRPGIAPSDALAAELQAFVKTRLAAHEYPRQVEFLPELPMTATGKIIRRALRG